MHDDTAVDADAARGSMLASLMTVAAAYAVRRGLALDCVADAAGLAPEDLIATSDRVPEDVVSRILALLEDEFPEEPVALEMAAAAPVSFLGPLAPMARLAPDLRTGIAMFVEYRSVLSTNAVLELIEPEPGPMLRFEHPNDVEFGAQNSEMGLMMGARSISEVFGVPDALRMVWVGHAPTGPGERYTELFGVPVRFDAPCDALLFHAHRLGEPVDPGAGARLRVVVSHLELVRDQLEQQRAPAELRRVRDAAARNAAHGEFGTSALARSQSMSLRTLQRRLAELGTTTQQVIDDVRAAMARQMLSDPDLSVIEISTALGYATESSFRRAFRRWTSLSPREYRQMELPSA